MATTFAVPDGRVAMAATTYTGSGGTNTISNAVNGVGLQPDLLWTKSRSSAAYHYIQNSVVGVNKALYSNTTDSEYTLTTTTTALNTNGFSFNGPESGLNASAATYVGWQWKAGGTAVSNTAGTITSSVSANTTAGFSVVTYTGNGVDTLSGVATVGHGLGVTPHFIITKKRSSGGMGLLNWSTYHVSNGNANIWLNTTSAKNPGNWVTAPTASVFSPPVYGYGNENGETYVNYCWAPVAGYSAFGSYTGNNSADGPFIYTGFRPRWILIKSTTVATSWYLLDSARETYNEEKIFLYPDLAQADSPQAYGVDFLSNGFKIRAPTGYGLNNASATYIYAAFAENPLKYSNAR